MAISVTTNARAVSEELGQTSYRATRRLAGAVRDEATKLRDAWRANAAESSGDHGKRYPAAIKADTFALDAVIYPDESAKQGAMSFEYGSRNQPPHLDGQRALDARAEWILRNLRIAALGD